MSKISQITEADALGLELEFVEAVHAGFPSPAADYKGERINIVQELNPHPETSFYARVSGDSMRDVGILDGDIVVVDRSLEPRNGDYIIAYVDGEYTLKEWRYDVREHCGWLIPHNPAFSPIRLTDDNRFCVWGVVTHAIHSTRK